MATRTARSAGQRGLPSAVIPQATGSSRLCDTASLTPTSLLEPHNCRLPPVCLHVRGRRGPATAAGPKPYSERVHSASHARGGLASVVVHDTHALTISPCQPTGDH